MMQGVLDPKNMANTEGPPHTKSTSFSTATKKGVNVHWVPTL